MSATARAGYWPSGHARVKEQDVAPRAVLAFANRFAEDVCDAFSGKEHRSSLAAAARLCTRGGRDFLIPQRRRRALAASDRRFLACQRRFCQRLRNLGPDEVARLVGATPPASYDAHPIQPLRVLDDLGQPPARLVEAVFEAFARITRSSTVMGAEDVLGLAVHALATGDDGPMRPSTGLYVARVYGVRDPALCDSGRDAEAKYLLTTLEAAVAAVAALGASEEATSTTEPETEHDDDDATSTEVDSRRARGRGRRRREGDDVSLRELGKWLSTESAREDTGSTCCATAGWVRCAIHTRFVTTSLSHASRRTRATSV